MPRRRKDETESGRWSVSVGEHGHTVRVHERERGGPVHLDWREGTQRRSLSLGFGVRTPTGALDELRAERATEHAKQKARRMEAAELERDLGEPVVLTVGEGFARYHDPKAGGLPASKSSRTHHDVTRRACEETFGKGRPWNAITPNEVDALSERVAKASGIPTADKVVKCLRTVYRWLHRRAGFENLKDPTRSFEFTKLRQGYEPARPRYTVAELRKLLAVRHEVDPRFALMLSLAVDSGARSKALYDGTRRMIDPPIDQPPPKGKAPYGYALLPAMKGAPRALTYLTLRQRVELTRALWARWNGARWAPGVLAKLEQRFLHGDVEDYPLIPGRNLDADGCATSLDSANVNTALGWLREAERKAGVPYVKRRGWHGIRRTWSDGIYEDTDLDTLTDAGGWTDRDTPAGIYLQRVRHGRLERAREAQEERWES